MAGKLYFKAHEAHELEGIALGDDAFPQFVVEMHFPVFDLIFEMHIPYLAVGRLRDFRQRQIVSCDDTNRAPIQEALQQTFSSDSAVFAIGSFQ